MRKKRIMIENKLQLVTTPEGTIRLAHHACPETGTYRGRQVFTPRSAKSKGIQEIEA